MSNTKCYLSLLYVDMEISNFLASFLVISVPSIFVESKQSIFRRHPSEFTLGGPPGDLWKALMLG